MYMQWILIHRQFLATTDNSANNAIDPGQISAGTSEILNNVSADIIIANILAAPILGIAKYFLRPPLRVRHTCLVRHFKHPTKDIIDSYSTYFENTGQRTEEDWACITLTRKH